MKIQNDRTNRLPDYGRMAQEKKEEQTMTQMEAERPVRLTISEKGLESYRESLAGGRSYEDAVKQKQFLKDVKLSPDLDYGFRFKIGESLSDEKRQAFGGSMTLQGRMEEMAQTYTSLYDEIVQGYRNGTRKINVADPGSEQGYRTLTLEEELHALDGAYEKAVRAGEEIAKQRPVAQRALEDYRSKLEKIGSKKADEIGKYLEKMKDRKECAPERLAEKMIQVKDEWKTRYALWPREEAWKNLSVSIEHMFQ